ncbi:hypothetical protein M9458_041745, partial [Cirrhinus mrigala]
MTVGALLSLISYVLSKKRSRVTSDAPHPGPPPAGTEAAVKGAQGDLGIAMENNPPGTSSRTSHSPARSVPLVEFPGGFDSPPQGGLDFSFGAPEGDEISVAVSEGGQSLSDAEASTGLPPSGFMAQSEAEAEMAAVLAWAAEGIGLEYVAPPSPKRSRLDDWFLGSEHADLPRSTPVPFFPEVHEELTKSWKAPFSSRTHFAGASALTTLNGGAARGYVDIPQVERAIAVHLCLNSAATWCGRPRPPSKACKLSSSLTARAYNASGQAASALHALAILQVYQAKALKEVDEGSTDPEVLRELRSATDYALRATKVTAQALGRAMSTLVAQERHLTPRSPPEDFANQFSAVKKQTEAIKQRSQDPGATWHVFPPKSPASAWAGSQTTTVFPQAGDATSPVPEMGDPGLERLLTCLPLTGRASLLRGEGMNFTTSIKEQFYPFLGQSLFHSVPDPRLHDGRTLHGNIRTSVDATSSPEPCLLLNRPCSHLVFTSRQEIANLLLKDAIEPVPPAEMKKGSYSPYFIVPKKGGGLRPILDLRVYAPHVKSLRTVHIPGHLNHVADALSRQVTFRGEWRLHPHTVQLIWNRFGEAQIDLFASHESTHCALWYSLTEAPLCTDALVHSWPRGPRKYAFPPVSLIAQTLCKVREERHQVLMVAPYWPNQTWFTDLTLLASAPPWRIPLRKDLLSQGQGTIWHPRPDLWNLHVCSETYHQRQLYALKTHRDVTLGQLRKASVRFHAQRLRGCCRSEPRPGGWQHNLIIRINPPRPRLIPSWDLSVVLLGLQRELFEPLQSVKLGALSMKTALLIALTSLKRVGDLQALSFGPACSHIVLRPRPGYVPKVPTTPFRDQVVNLQAFPSERGNPALSLLCPVRALRIYLERTQSFRQSEQLFVCFGGQRKGKAVSKQRLAHWIVDAILRAYQAQDVPCPLSVRAHSTRGVAATSALAHGASLADICRAAGWATPNTFARFYNLRMEPVSSRVFGDNSACATTLNRSSSASFTTVVELAVALYVVDALLVTPYDLSPLVFPSTELVCHRSLWDSPPQRSP